MQQSEELMHHGILGMKWGVKNGPPYPLKPEVSARVSKGRKPSSGSSSGSGSGGSRRRPAKPQPRQSSPSPRRSSQRASEKRSGSTSGGSSHPRAQSKPSPKSPEPTRSKTETGRRDAKVEAAKRSAREFERRTAPLERDFDEADARHDDEAKAKIGAKISKFYDEHKTAIHIAIGAAMGVGAVAGGMAAAKYIREQRIKAPLRKNYFKNVENRAGSVGKFAEFMKNGKVSDLPDEDTTFHVGHEFQRVSVPGGDAFHVDGTKQDMTYVTTNRADATRVASLFPSYFGRRDKTDNFHQMTYKATKEVRSPSARKRYMLFVNLCRKNPEFCEALVGDCVIHFGQVPSFNYEANQSKADREFMAAYRVFCRKFGGRGDSAKIYVDELKKMGYNAIIDDNDAGILTDMPLVIFDNSTYEQTGDKVWNYYSDEFREFAKTIEQFDGMDTWKTPLNHGALMHHGVLGMKWGVRKEKPRAVGKRKSKEPEKRQRKRLPKGAVAAIGVSAALTAPIWMPHAKNGYRYLEEVGAIGAISKGASAVVKGGKVAGATAGKVAKVGGKAAGTVLKAGGRVAGETLRTAGQIASSGSDELKESVRRNRRTIAKNVGRNARRMMRKGG